MWVSDAAKVHYRQVAAQETLALAAARKAWRQVEPRYLVDSWVSLVESLFPTFANVQREVAFLGSEYSAGVLADQGFWVPPEGWVDPDGFAGVAAHGGNMRAQMLEPAFRAQRLIDQGLKESVGLQRGLSMLQMLTVSALADTGRAAAGVDIALRPQVGYVRVAHASACDRCLILAGQFYRWNQGFARHPNCRCVHEVTTGPRSEDMKTDPYEVFNELSKAEQNARFGQANAEAIREGADIYQVVSAKRGVTKSRMFTTYGTTKRGYAGQLLRPGQRRLTPEGIYRQAKGSRLKARELLTEHGYLLPGGQVPGGSLRGLALGWGQMGKGGRAAAARDAMNRAVATGLRDPSNRYTMTAAERRLYDAEQRYRMVLEGRNPFASPGFGNIPDPKGLGLNQVGAPKAQPLTPQISAMVEKDYRRWLATGGQIY